MRDWYGTAKTIIAEVHATLPDDADLTTRHQACLRAKPFEFATTSWGTKTWARAQREYLVKFGYVPKTPAGKAGLPLLSPLEEAKRKGDQHQAVMAQFNATMEHIESELDRIPRKRALLSLTVSNGDGKMNMIERVARAIDPSTWENWDNWIRLKDFTEAEAAEEFARSPSLHKSLARAADAIDAMREPSREMMTAIGYPNYPDGWGPWGSMIDAALVTTPSKL